MQIQPSSAASAAAGSITQATSKDRTAGSSTDIAANHVPAGVERLAKGEAANADRDAQGGGYGPSARAEQGPTESTESTPSSVHEALPVIAPEPPGELDLIG